MAPVPGVNESEINQIMQDAEIQNVSIASGNDKDNINVMPFPKNSQAETTESVFGVASLSKPVFTYLVLKLLNDKDFKLDTKLNSSILSFEDFCAKFNIIWKDTPENRARANQLTPEMILSHQTGLPIGYDHKKSEPIQFEFEPNTGFGYTGISLMYLQEWIQLKFKKSLEELAKEYVFNPAGMGKQTTFEHDGKTANAANSLYTTASDYVRFCIHWMNDPDPNVQKAFESKVSLRKDAWALRENVPTEVLDHISWGYGFGLENRSDGKRIAFHTGDANEWRTGVQLDLESKTAKVFLSKSAYGNGHLLQEPIFGKSNVLECFFDKFKFARKVDELREDWRVTPSHGFRKETIAHTYEPPSQQEEHRTSHTPTYR